MTSYINLLITQCKIRQQRETTAGKLGKMCMVYVRRLRVGVNCRERVRGTVAPLLVKLEYKLLNSATFAVENCNSPS
jgi:hypothetical protein